MFLAYEQEVTESISLATKMNLYLNISVYNFISPTNIKYENKINN